MQSSVVAVITEEMQNDVVAALHASGVGHLTRVIRQERGAIADQLRRAGIDTSALPDTIADAERAVLVTPTAVSLETACLLLQRGATSAWTLTPESGWEVVDDTALEIAATRELPARPLASAHRSARTFRKQNIRRRPRRGITSPAAKSENEDAASS